MRGMKLALNSGLALALAMACGSAAAKDLQCDVDSDYDLNVTDKSVILTKETGTPKAIVMRDGRMFIDNAWVNLSKDDSRRIADYEKHVRATLPLAAQIGRDAADIAFTALGEVATGLSAHPEQTRAALAKSRADIDKHMAKAVSANRFNGNELGNSISHAISEVLPPVIGDIVGGAISAAFSGDDARIERMNNLDKEIERRVQPRANQLEKRAEALCRRMEALDAIDNALVYRLPDGSRLDLIDARMKVRNDYH
ncbi:DUF2884 family protein [Noviluteimonas gilva]|uniref:DUF2884 family protein n=1 Tax=Noviluteimonas gilva TaxID=2682097 RepID=A0A7C9LVQ1_9GAMM|nr:DUF2884 family protein [Lysobacter gilvus]MUV12885.1 DUF2884 family protein [Lysobacter gilvus]